MLVSEGLDSLRSLPPASVATIGNFDGLHVGHLALIRLTLQTSQHHPQRAAHEVSGPPPSSTPAVVITFEPHPLTVLKPDLAPPVLTPISEKLRLLKDLGIHHTIILPPTPEVLGLTAEAFYSILKDHARIAALVEGDNFAFGKSRTGNITNLSQWCHRDNIHLTVIPPVERTLCDSQIAPVSSSLIRWLLHHGRMTDVTTCLGRPYRISGIVSPGNQRGRTLGFPTANLPTIPNMLPGDGVYAATATTSSGQSHPAAVSIGTNPTFNGTTRLVEAHLIGFSDNLYGQPLTLDLTHHLRDQSRFPNLQLLKSQLTQDITRARQLATV